MDKKQLNRIFLMAAAGAFVLIGVIAAVRALRPEPAAEELVVIEEPEAEVVDVQIVEASPTPSPEPETYEGTVTLLVDRVPVFTLASEYDAKALLWDYLTLCAVAPEGERFVSARFDCELIVTAADSYVEPISGTDALRILQNAPQTVPVLVTTQRVEYESGTAEVTESNEDALAKGCRIVTQLGAGALTETLTQITYRAGEAIETGEPTITTLHEARATIIRVGSYSVKDPSGEPGKKEGPQGKSAGDLALTYPMRGQVTAYFGFCDGEMQNGIDITNKAGTSVAAPGEGIVVYCGERGAYGFVVDIDHGNGFVSRLTHLSDVQVELNQRVFSGDVIGTLAEAENDAKPYLHYELIIDGIPYNPLYYLS